MKKTMKLCAMLLALAALLSSYALADADTFYPVSVERSADGTEVRKIYELSPEDDPAGIPRSDFEQSGWHYTLLDLLKQEQPEYEETEHTETVELESEKKDMESVLALLPQEQEFITEDGFAGVLSLKLDTIRVENGETEYYNWTPTATRTYPGLASQDTSSIPKSIEEKGYTLTLQNVEWRADSASEVDGYQIGGSYTAVASYSATVLGSRVKGYTVTADYTGTVSRTALNKVRYVAVFEGVNLNPEPEPAPEPEPVPDPIFTVELPKLTPEVTEPVEKEPPIEFNFTYVWIILGGIALVGGGIGVALIIKRKSESESED